MECLDSYTYKYYEHKWVFEFLHRFVISDSYTKFYTMCINELSNFYTDQYIMHTRELDCILFCLCYQIARPVDRNDLCSRWRSGQINSMQHQNNNFFKIFCKLKKEKGCLKSHGISTVPNSCNHENYFMFLYHVADLFFRYNWKFILIIYC